MNFKCLLAAIVTIQEVVLFLTSHKIEDIGSISSATLQTQEPENTENEILLRLKKQKDIQEAWAKCNKAVFKVLGKMTTGAYQAALKNVKWEKRFKKKGKNMQVHYSQVELKTLYNIYILLKHKDGETLM